MPLIQTRANGSARGYGFASLKLGGGSYYVAYYDTTSGATMSGNVPALASDNSIYCSGNSSQYPTIQKAIKIGPTGTLIFQKTFNTAGDDSNQGGTIVDSSGNCYSGVTVNTTTSSYTTWGVIKSNSTGTTVTLSGQNAGRYNISAGCIFFDSSSNLYLYGWSGQYPATANCGLLKFNSSMSVVGSAILDMGGAINGYAGANIDSSGNLYCSGYVYVSGTPRIFLVKTTMTVPAWAYTFSYGGASTTSSITQLPIDSSGNVYIFGSSGSTGLISKINSSGTEVWTKTLTNGATFGPSNIRIDPAGAYLYLSIYCGATGSEKNRVVKMDTSSGSVIWEREFYTTSGTNGPYFGCDVNSNCYMIEAPITVSTVSKNIIGVFPTDGTKTGTYTVGGVTLVYGAPSSAITVGSTTLTRASMTNPSVYPSGGTNTTTPITIATPTQTFSSTAI